MWCICDCELVAAPDPAAAAAGQFGFFVRGETDPSRYTRTKITKDDLKDRVLELLKNVPKTANVAGTFSAVRCPREVLFRVVD